MSNIQFKVITWEELGPIQDMHYQKMFANRAMQPTLQVSEEHQALIKDRRKKYAPWELIVGVYDGNNPIGWHFGNAVDAETFYMKNSAILPEYRSQGIYSALLSFVLTQLKKEGFQVVTSIHHGNNPAVLIPKLKKGFVISGTQFHEKFRFLIELRYFFDSERKKAYGKSMGLEL